MATARAAAAALDLDVTGRVLPPGSDLDSRLLLLRQQRHLSRQAVATMAAISIPAVTQVERTSQGHLSTLEAIGRVLGAGLCLRPAGERRRFTEHVAMSSGNVEWYTPDWFIDRVIAATGAIDLDPASPGHGNTRFRRGSTSR